MCAGCKAAKGSSSISSLWSKLFHLLVWKSSGSALVRPALSWLGSLKLYMLPACSVMGDEVLGVEGGELCWEGEEKGRWGKWCTSLACSEIVGGELMLDDHAQVELLVHIGYSIALGTCSHLGDFSGKQISWPSVVLYCVQEIASLLLMGKQLLVSMTHL